MPKALFAWEMGGGLGHAAPIRAVAERLTRPGWTATAAVANPALCKQMLVDLDVVVLPAPRPTPQPIERACTFPEVLYGNGYGDRAEVMKSVAEWNAVIERTRPDVLVADSSPCAMLAARGRGLPTATVGAPFFCPTDASPSPSLDPSVAEPPAEAAETERCVLEAFNSALSEAGAAALPRVSTLYAPPVRNFVLTVPELDPFPNRPPSDYATPLKAPFRGADVAWPRLETAAPRLFLYGWNDPFMFPLLRALRESAASTIAYVPDLPLGEQRSLSSPQLSLCRHAVDLKPILRSADVAVLNGGHGSVSSFLLSGVPMVVVPRSLEQAVTAHRVALLRAGLVAKASAPGSVFAGIEDVLADDSFRKAAATVSARYDLLRSDGVAGIVQGLDKMVDYNRLRRASRD